MAIKIHWVIHNWYMQSWEVCFEGTNHALLCKRMYHFKEFLQKPEQAMSAVPWRASLKNLKYHLSQTLRWFYKTGTIMLRKNSQYERLQLKCLIIYYNCNHSAWCMLHGFLCEHYIVYIFSHICSPDSIQQMWVVVNWCFLYCNLLTCHSCMATHSTAASPLS